MRKIKNRNLSVLAIIPARGGSKGLPGKNIYPVNGKPLIAYTIDAALKATHITKTIVSSDNDEIIKVSAQLGAIALKRPRELAQDTSSSEEVIRYVIQTSSAQGEKFDILVLLQPTSPLRSAEDIDNAIEHMLNNNASAVISVTNIGIKPFKSYYLNKNGFLQGIHNNKSPNIRRQELPDAYLANGAIYGIYVEEFLKTNSLIPNATIPFVMDEEKSIDIDSLADIKLLKSILRVLP